MASIEAKAKRNFSVMTRMEEVVTRLSAAYNIESKLTGKIIRDSAGRIIRDKELAQIVQLENFTELLEMLETNFKAYDFRDKVPRFRQK